MFRACPVDRSWAGCQGSGVCGLPGLPGPALQPGWLTQHRCIVSKFRGLNSKIKAWAELAPPEAVGAAWGRGSPVSGGCWLATLAFLPGPRGSGFTSAWPSSCVCLRFPLTL